MKAGNIEQFKHLSNFRDLKDFNNHMEAFLAQHKKDFTKSELICFKALLRFSAKVVGVSNISINKLLQSISERYGDVSESTFHRMKRKAIKLGILTAYTTHRKNNSQSSNVWVFNRFLNSQTIDTPISDVKQEKVAKNQENIVEQLTPQKTNNNFKTSNLLNKRNDNVSDNKYLVDKLDASFVPSSVPKKFVDTVKPFFNSAKQIYDLFQRVQIAYEKCKLDRPLDELIDIAVESFKATIFAKKMEKIKKTFEGYFYTVLYSNFVVEKRRENRHLLYDFLNDEI